MECLVYRYRPLAVCRAVWVQRFSLWVWKSRGSQRRQHGTPRQLRSESSFRSYHPSRVRRSEHGKAFKKPRGSEPYELTCASALRGTAQRAYCRSTSTFAFQTNPEQIALDGRT